jgi:hypothetical protein
VQRGATIGNVASLTDINTARFIPFQSVEPLILKHPDYPDPFFSGTGFFILFPPFPQVFFVTARHCVLDAFGNPKGEVQVSVGASFANPVPFECMLTTLIPGSEDEFEDVAVLPIGGLPEEQHAFLQRRALRIQHQDAVDLILSSALTHRGKLRTVGFPGVSKEIDADRARAVVQPRGFHGDLFCGDAENRWYVLENMNWSAGEFDGFSGSPIIELMLEVEGEELASVPVGVMLTAGPSKVRFISINVVTDLIASYLRK